jgi:hypothetical protein
LNGGTPLQHIDKRGRLVVFLQTSMLQSRFFSTGPALEQMCRIWGRVGAVDAASSPSTRSSRIDASRFTNRRSDVR